ncbi:hypothetical protein [Pedobacter sp. KBS0701]|uniref:hypothetical protein n=1 Tax=unclassified Pedobacter TaxID=2628915 RepID=UPI00110ED3C2|nr:hypothetical protein [Pedobacter sp. KBS0701]QDW26481.1 hypothetical protein FFJ24_017310 [Pedobacter sp. KBS0701]
MEKVNHQKIIISTLLKFLLMVFIIFTINSWPSINQSFSGNTPPFDYWLDHSFKFSNIILILGFTAYFYYKDLTDQKQLIERSKDINQH